MGSQYRLEISGPDRKAARGCLVQRMLVEKRRNANCTHICSRQQIKKSTMRIYPHRAVVERRGLEPRTLCLQSRCSPN